MEVRAYDKMDYYVKHTYTSFESTFDGERVFIYLY